MSMLVVILSYEVIQITSDGGQVKKLQTFKSMFLIKRRIGTSDRKYQGYTYAIVFIIR